jgi:hypothetical protein
MISGTWTAVKTGTYGNGINWVTGPIATNGSGTVVAWASFNQSVYGGGSNFAYSTNHGVTWTGVGLGNAPQNMVAAECVWASNLSLFVATGWVNATNNARIVTSPDGITWTSRTVPTQLATNRLYYLSYSNNTLVVQDANGNLASSTDAVNWTFKTTQTTANQVAYLASTGYWYGNGVFSPDLVNWALLPKRSGYSDYTSIFNISDGTRLYSNAGAAYLPQPYTTSTQFIVPDYGSLGLGSAPVFGSTYYIKT